MASVREGLEEAGSGGAGDNVAAARATGLRLPGCLHRPKMVLHALTIKAVYNTNFRPDLWDPAEVDAEDEESAGALAEARASTLANVLLIMLRSTHGSNDAALFDGVVAWIRRSLNGVVHKAVVQHLLHHALSNFGLLNRIVNSGIFPVNPFLLSMVLTAGSTHVLDSVIALLGDGDGDGEGDGGAGHSHAHGPLHHGVLATLLPLVRTSTFRAAVEGDAPRVAALLRYWKVMQATSVPATAARAFAERMTRLAAPGGPLDHPGLDDAGKARRAEVAEVVAAHAAQL